MYLIQQSRKEQRRGFAVLATLFYLLTAAIVPPGYMAAPLSSGTAFHLCPGDTRSAVLIDALAAVAKTASHEHHQAKQHNAHHGDHADSISETSVDAGCFFAGVGGALAVNARDSVDEKLLRPYLPQNPVTPTYQTSAWLRPPARSPPV